MPPESDHHEDRSTLEETRERLYAPADTPLPSRTPLSGAKRILPHAWQNMSLPEAPQVKEHHMKLASYFFIGALAFFGLSLVIAGYLLYFGGNAVSVRNITLKVEGPTTIAGGDTVPLTIAVTNRNPVELENAVLEVDFPPGTRDTENVLQSLPSYREELGTIKSGETVTRSVKAIIFGSSDTTVELPISLSYTAKGSNSTFVKKSSYPIDISSTPLSISAETIAETIAGKPFTVTLQVRSNAAVPIDDVAVLATLPFGFSLTSSSMPANGSLFSLGTLAPGESRTITLTGILDGQNGDERTLHFAVGTGKGAAGLTLTYMKQEAKVAITAPFIETSLTLNGSPVSTATLAPGEAQSVMVGYTNTLSTNLSDATIAVAISGAAVDYDSIGTTNGYYRSSDHTVLFSRDTDPALASLAPGASGLGSFSFSTVSAEAFGRSPSVTFTISVTGTRPGQSNVPEQVTASRTYTVKAATAVTFSAASVHAGGTFANSGPIPPIADQKTTYGVVWTVQNAATAVADGVVTATLPSYVEYTGITSGQGSIVFDPKSRTVTWRVGDLAANASATTAFQVALTPSTSQKGASPTLTSEASFSGHDRFANVAVSAATDPVTTETVTEPGYTPGDGTVQ